jgi:sulfur-oxidizing protein SoxY
MNGGRRRILKGTGGAAMLGLAMSAGLFRTGSAWADWNKAAFDTKSFADAVKANVPKTESMALLIEKNPNILAANFQIPQGTEPWINTRVKMGQTSNVIALVKTTDGKFYYASKEVKVTLGGCGG